jgi:hypothetical protein
VPPEFHQSREAWRFAAADDNILCKFDPGMRLESIGLTRNSQAQPAGDPPPTQHRLCSKRARQTTRLHPSPCTHALYRG